MTLRRSHVGIAAVAGALLAWGTAAQAAPSYEVIDLGAGLTQTSSASGINSAGQVVGQVAGAAAIFEAGQVPRTLESLLAGSSWAFDISASGHVVGQAASEAFLLTSQGAQMLGFLGGNWSMARGINASGQVIGDSFVGTGFDRRGFLYSGGVMQDLGSLGGSRSTARDINDAGQITGSSSTADGRTVAYLYQGGQMTALPSLGGDWASGQAVNSFGQVAGYGTFSGADTNTAQAFLVDDDQVRHIGTLGGAFSIAWDVNDAGWVVGRSTTEIADQSAGFVYGDGQLWNLNTLLAPGSDWTIAEATGINNLGQIAATGCSTRVTDLCHALLLNPVQAVPEPATTALMLAGLGVLGLVQRRSRAAKTRPAG